MNPRLVGKAALVTGAAAGIGRAVTDAYVAEGARVLALDVDADGLHRLELDHGDAVVTAGCDVTDESEVERAARLAADRFGGLDIVVANAGKGGFSPIVDHDLELWNDIVGLCLTGVFLTLKHGARVMRHGGSIITIASLNATQPAAGMAAYCAAKAGVVQLTRVAAMELGHRGIRANAIAPGLVRTAASSPFWLVPGVVDEFVENTTVGRFAQPEDVAAFAVFLGSDESSFVSGSMHAIDGGASTKRYPDLVAALAGLDQLGGDTP